MKALTLWQPWASLIALGEKTVETRCWDTKYRGELAIHAATRMPARYLGASRYLPAFGDECADVLKVKRDAVGPAINQLPRGAVLCVVRLMQVERTEFARSYLCQRELIFGNYDDGRYAWILELVEKFETPIPAKGNRMLWNWQR